MQTTRDLTGTVVAITGATAGIGRETARLLVADGARVALGGRRTDRLDELVAELGAENAVGVPMDVRLPADNARLVAAAVDRWGRLDSVIPNAGIGMYGGILDQSDDELTTMMDTNYAGTVWTVRAALPALLAAGGGDIVIVSSVAGFRGGADEAVYAGTKAALIGFGKSLAVEVARDNITVNVVSPGSTDTEFIRRILTEEQMNRRVRANPMGRLGTPVDVADAVGFFCSDRAAYISGQVLSVNGGMSRLG